MGERSQRCSCKFEWEDGGSWALKIKKTFGCVGKPNKKNNQERRALRVRPVGVVLTVRAVGGGSFPRITKGGGMVGLWTNPSERWWGRRVGRPCNLLMSEES